MLGGGGSRMGIGVVGALSERPLPLQAVRANGIAEKRRSEIFGVIATRSGADCE